MNNQIEFNPGPEQDALTVLWNGLEHLNARLLKLEEAESKRYTGWFGGGGTALNHPDRLMPNYFIWYATNAYAFLTLFIKTQVLNTDDESRITSEAYREFPQLVTWRHKIGAHLAFVFPRKESETTLANSLLFLGDFEFDQPNRGRQDNRTQLRDNPSVKNT